MSHSFARLHFLEELRRQNSANLELVQATFLPLDRAVRSAQPEPGEWCVDQCFQHLVLSFEMHMEHVLPVLERSKDMDLAESFTRSWLARTRYYRSQFDPQTKTKTLKRVTPSDHYYPDVFAQYAAQKERMAAILERARKVDLQQRCWFLGFFPINLGDYLELCVLHDVLHIDQAQRALMAYRQNTAVLERTI